MKLFCKGEYHNVPAQLHFDAAGVIEVDDSKAEYLLRDAPENFAVYVQPLEEPLVTRTVEKSLDESPHDKMVREPKKKK